MADAAVSPDERHRAGELPGGDAWELTRRDVRERLGAIPTPLRLSPLGGTARLPWTSPFRITDWRFVP